MKARLFLLVFFLSMLKVTGYSQERTGRDSRDAKKLEKEKQTEEMVKARNFVFVARRAFPTGMSTVDLTLNQNFVKFQPDLIDSYMPFFGTGYGGIGYGTNAGLVFKGQPKVFTVGKSGNGWQINAVVNGTADSFELTLSVGSEGNASLTITSNYRSTISYQGEISAPS